MDAINKVIHFRAALRCHGLLPQIPIIGVLRDGLVGHLKAVGCFSSYLEIKRGSHTCLSGAYTVVM